MRACRSSRTGGVLRAGAFAGAALVGLSEGSTAQGAPEKSFWLEGAYFPSAGFSDAPQGLADSGVRTWTAIGGMSLPFVLSGSSVLSFQISYGRMRLEGVGLPTEAEAPGPLHSVDAGVSITRVLSPKWIGVVRAAAGVASDLRDGFEARELAPSFLALMTRRFNENWTLSFGAVYAPSSAFAFPIPIVNAAWADGQRWRAALGPPSGAEIWYALAEGSELGFKISLEGGEYRTRTLFPADDARLRRLGVTLGPGLRVPLLGGSSIDLHAGYSLQSIRLRDGGESIEGGAFDLESGFFLRTGLRVSL